MDTVFPSIALVVSCKFNSEHQQLQLSSQMQAVKLEKFMKERKHDSVSEALHIFVALINSIVPQLPDGFSTERHKLNFVHESGIYHQ